MTYQVKVSRNFRHFLQKTTTKSFHEFGIEFWHIRHQCRKQQAYLHRLFKIKMHKGIIINQSHKKWYYLINFFGKNIVFFRREIQFLEGQYRVRAITKTPSILSLSRINQTTNLYHKVDIGTVLSKFIGGNAFKSSWVFTFCGMQQLESGS